MTRWRLVSHQNGRRHVSSVVLSADEAIDALDFEAHMHEAAGWTVTQGDLIVVATRGDISRVIEAQAFEAMADALS